MSLDNHGKRKIRALLKIKAKKSVLCAFHSACCHVKKEQTLSLTLMYLYDFLCRSFLYIICDLYIFFVLFFLSRPQIKIKLMNEREAGGMVKSHRSYR